MDIVEVKEVNEIKYLLAKYNERYIKPLTEEEIEELSKKFFEYAIVYKAVENNIDLGYIAFYANNFKEKKAFISQICVDKDAGNKGIGKVLIDTCIEKCRKNNISTIQLFVYNKNEIAINFYKKMGFYMKELDEFENIICMEKNIL